MKTKLLSVWMLLKIYPSIVSFFLIFALCPTPCALCQIPQGFNYQAIACDGSGLPLSGLTISVRLGIQSDTTASPVILWEEEHTGIKTTAFGLFTVVLGTGSKSGGSAATFADVNWSVTPLYLKTQIYYAGEWKYMGSSKLWSTPYAMKSKDTETKQTLSLSGTTLGISGGNTVSLTTATNQWQTDGTNIYRQTGNVGIGTAAPSALFHVTGNTRLNNSMVGDGIELMAYSTGNRFAGIDFHGDDTYTDYALRIIRYNTGPNAPSWIEHRGTGVLSLRTDDAGDINFVTNSAERMRITTDGNIGIGTASPTKKLEISGAGSSIYFNSSTSNLLEYNMQGVAPPSYNTRSNGTKIALYPGVSATTAEYALGIDASTFWMSVPNNTATFKFYAGTSELMRIMGTGNIGIGTTNPGTYKLYVNGGSAIINDGTGLSGTLKLAGHSYIGSADWGNLTLSTGVNSGNAALFLATENQIRMVIAGNGNVGFGATASTSKMVILPPNTWADDLPLFEVKNKSGETVFAVYNNGIRAYVKSNAAKGLKGGFAIGGFDPTKAGVVDLMTVSPDSIRFSIDNGTEKGQKGGFAIGSFDNTKGTINQEFMYVTPQYSGSGKYNTFLGYQSGINNNNLGNFNSFIGYQAGYANTSGFSNVFLGHYSGGANNTGSENTFLGENTGSLNTTGSQNVFIGSTSGLNNIAGNKNTLLGYNSGMSIRGNGNICLGYASGPTALSSLNDRLYIDNYSGAETSSYIYGVMTPGSKIFRFNTNVGIWTTPSSTYALSINGSAYLTGGNLGLNVVANAAYGLVVSGGTSVTYSLYAYKGGYTPGNWTSGSDFRLKKNIQVIENVLEKLNNINPVRFKWNIDSFPERQFTDGMQIGLIAQEMEKEFPELVSSDAEGYKAIAYDKFTAVLLSAVKEQQKQIEDQKVQIKVQDEKVMRLEKMVEEMQALLSKNGLK